MFDTKMVNYLRLIFTDGKTISISNMVRHHMNSLRLFLDVTENVWFSRVYLPRIGVVSAIFKQARRLFSFVQSNITDRSLSVSGWWKKNRGKYNVCSREGKKRVRR